MNYQNYEIYFCVKDQDDLSIDIIEQLIKSYPHINAELLIGTTVYNIQNIIHVHNNVLLIQVAMISE